MGNKLSFEILGGVIGLRSKKPQQRGLVFWPSKLYFGNQWCLDVF